MENICKNCGNKTEVSFEYCPKCGSKINDNNNANDIDIKSTIILNKKKLILVLSSVCAVVIALIIGITNLSPNSDNDDGNTNQEEPWKDAEVYDLNEVISEGGTYEFKINYSEWSEGGKVYARNAYQKSSGYIFGIETNSENTFIVRGMCKNIASKSACTDLGNPYIKAIVVFDDKYVTEGYVELEDPDGMDFYNNYNFNPKVELPITFYFPSSIEMEENYEKAVLYIHTIDSEEDIGKFYTGAGENIEGVYMGIRLKWCFLQVPERMRLIMFNKYAVTIINFLIKNYCFIVAFSAFILSLLMIFQIVFVAQNVDISNSLKTAEIYEESAEEFKASVEELEDGAVKNTYENISSNFLERAEEQRETARKASIKLGIYSVLALSFVGITGTFIFISVKKKKNNS